MSTRVEAIATPSSAATSYAPRRSSVAQQRREGAVRGHDAVHVTQLPLHGRRITWRCDTGAAEPPSQVESRSWGRSGLRRVSEKDPGSQGTFLDVQSVRSNWTILGLILSLRVYGTRHLKRVYYWDVPQRS